MVSPTQHEGLADSSRTCCNSRPRDRWEFFTRVRSRPARSATAVLIQGFHAKGRLQRAESVYDCRRIDRCRKEGWLVAVRGQGVGRLRNALAARSRPEESLRAARAVLALAGRARIHSLRSNLP